MYTDTKEVSEQLTEQKSWSSSNCENKEITTETSKCQKSQITVWIFLWCSSKSWCFNVGFWRCCNMLQLMRLDIASWEWPSYILPSWCSESLYTVNFKRFERVHKPQWLLLIHEKTNLLSAPKNDKMAPCYGGKEWQRFCQDYSVCAEVQKMTTRCQYGTMFHHETKQAPVNIKTGCRFEEH